MLPPEGQLTLYTPTTLLSCVSANVNEIHIKKGVGVGGSGNSDRIHGPTNEYNDRAQYVIDYGFVVMY